MHRWITFGLLLLLTSAAMARPQYSAITGQGCWLCHSNPTGGGMRALYGSQFFGPTYLPMKPVNFEMLEKLKPSLSESVTIGADLRTIFLATNTQTDSTSQGLSAPFSTNTGTSSQMEGYIYLDIHPSDEFMIYYSQGISQANGRYEAYGLASILPFEGYLKGGQFQEHYGWRFADHTSFVRTGLWSDYIGGPYDEPTPPQYGVGGEIGFRPHCLDVNFSYTNSNGAVPGDLDSQKRWVARAMAQHSFPKWKLSFTGGGSWMHAPGKAQNPEFPGFNFPPFGAVAPRTAWGGFGGIGWEGMHGTFCCDKGFGFLATTLLFEYDRKIWSPPDAFQVMSAYSTSQVEIMIQQGLWLTGAYDWMDNDESENVGMEVERSTVGIEFYPISWVELSPKYRLYSGEGYLRNKQQYEMQAHFFF